MSAKNVNTATGEIKGAASKFERKGRVTFPLLKQEEGQRIHILFTSSAVKGEPQMNDDGTVKQEGAHVARAVDLNTDGLVEVILTAVTLAKLDEHYPDGGYVGKGFEILLQAKVAGKKYRNVEIFELDIPADYEIPKL